MVSSGPFDGEFLMAPPSPNEMTRLLVEWSEGDPAALEKLTPLVHQELRRLAHRYMSRERPGHTLQTTALVNEAYLRLVDQKQAHWKNRTHFFAVASRVMRHILIDHARQNVRAKRGGKTPRISLDEAAVMSPERAADLLALDEALDELAMIEPRRSRVVELRYFGGLNIEETAEILKVTATTVSRDWRWAKAWLYRAITGEK
jgi:RNA polymerase sigma-70 factor, ECF subfamily